MSRKADGGESGRHSGMQGINLKVLKRMLKFMEDAGLTELDLEVEGVKVRLRKGGGSVESTTAAPVMYSVPAPAATPIVAPVYAPPPASPAVAPPVIPPVSVNAIKSPMVGTFYRAPSPTANPFVAVGDVIKEGQTLCLIEAMKLMNEIKAEKAGKISKILAENGSPIEFDQPLFELEPV